MWGIDAGDNGVMLPVWTLRTRQCFGMIEKIMKCRDQLIRLLCLRRVWVTKLNGRSCACLLQNEFSAWCRSRQR
uniref:Uncharacterized protein n=1 Tax=Hyaloperonospora arabidopsidis (strain Emoy2) TaxID=559515 RepID=M4BCU4_HYAAE